MIGGLDLKDLVSRILATLCGPDLAVNVNFTGANGKLNFKSSDYLGVIKGTQLIHLIFPI